MAATDQGKPIAAVHNESTPGMIKELLDRMKRLRTELLKIRQPILQGRDNQRTSHAYQSIRSSTNSVCWPCNRPGHFAREWYT